MSDVLVINALIIHRSVCAEVRVTANRKRETVDIQQIQVFNVGGVSNEDPDKDLNSSTTPIKILFF